LSSYRAKNGELEVTGKADPDQAAEKKAVTDVLAPAK